MTGSDKSSMHKLQLSCRNLIVASPVTPCNRQGAAMSSPIAIAFNLRVLTIVGLMGFATPLVKH